jgi:Zn-dependent M28 family amino/carboxypeptidase
MDGPGPAVPIPQVQVSIPVAERLMAVTGVTLADLEARAGEANAPSSALTGARVHVRTVAAYRPAVPTVNVVARIPGTDLAGEAVVVSAHLDHVGCQGAVCWPGANDNASGSAAVIAIAGALTRPRRTVVAVLYASEEHGLDGSEAFAASPPVPVDRIVAQVNLDCIGIGDGLQVGGGQASPRLWEIARTIDATTTKRMIEDTWWGGGADAQALFDRDVPTLYFATHDAYAHLHLPTDTVDTLDPDLLADTVRLAHRVVAVLAGGGYAREPRQSKPPPERP